MWTLVAVAATAFAAPPKPACDGTQIFAATDSFNITIDQSTGTVVQWTVMQPWDKTVGQGAYCDDQGNTDMVSVWTYFNESLCFAFGNEQTKRHKYADNSACMTAQGDQLLPWSGYAAATYKDSEPCPQGGNCDVWTGDCTTSGGGTCEWFFQGNTLMAQTNNGQQTTFSAWACPAPSQITGQCLVMADYGIKEWWQTPLPHVPHWMHTLKVNDKKMIEKINSEKLGWKAAPTPFMAGKSMFEVSKLMGTIMVPPMASRLHKKEKTTLTWADIPDSFDATTQWPNCGIDQVRNQGDCGSCWAFGATESMEDRWCIESGATTPVVMAPEWLVDCDPHDGGCGGGFLDNAWEALNTIGMVTETCDPYQYCPYPANTNCSQVGTKSSTKKVQSSCSSCADGSSPQMYYVNTPYMVAQPGDTASMATELMTNGPLEVAFFVFSDFMNYQSGVYKRSPGAGLLGGHAVKLVGWGTEDGTPYWRIANSWSPQWGDQGYFKIFRGDNECAVESMATAAMTKQ